MLSKIETIPVTILARRDDSYRSVEQRARQRWAQILADRGESWHHVSIQLVGSEPDTEAEDQLIYRFEGATIESVPVSRPPAADTRQH